MVWVLALALLTACGRIGFDVAPDGSELDGSEPDAAVAPNRVFMTADASTGDLGGLVGADARCQAAADAAALGGDFIALLWSTTGDPTTRLGSARGWVDVRGRPIADQAADFVLGGTLNPLQVDELGRAMFDRNAWLGGPSSTCADWTVATGDTGGILMSSDCTSTPSNNPFTQCTTAGHLVCVERAREVAVVPEIAAGRIAFLAESYVPSGGLGAADARCAADASAAGLPGSYLAWLGTSTSEPEDRFGDGPPWRRVDGVLLATTALEFLAPLDPPYLASFLNRTAAGAISTQLTFTGVNGGHCDDWTASPDFANIARPGTSLRADFRITPFTSTCGTPRAIVCLQQ